MSTFLGGFSETMNGFKVNHQFIDPPFLQIPTIPQHPPNDLSPPLTTGLEGDYSPETNGDPNVILKFISEMLMEEEMEAKPCMLQNCLALQAAEKSFYDVLGQNYPDPSSNHLPPPCFDQNFESSDDNLASSSSFDSSNSYGTQAEFEQTSVFHSYGNTLLVPDFFSEIIDLESTPSELTRDAVVAKPEKHEGNNSPNGSGRNDSPNGSRRKNREDSDLEEEEGRSNKHSAVSARDSEPSDIFDKILLNCSVPDDDSASCSLLESAENGGSLGKLQNNGNSRGSNGKTTRSRKKGNKGEAVDLWSLLTQCAQAVASSDQRTTNDILKQIRQHASSVGDGTERLAHYFANALEARLAGTRTPAYSPILSNTTSAADILKAYQVYVTACPFKTMSNVFANRSIKKLVEKENATRLHIIDFGIAYGFQWPCLIQRLSARPAGPPKLRITGIELPQPGFRPTERVEETGRRLANYCQRFNVPFEFNVIAKKWETIQLEDLKLDREEDGLLVVNSLYRFKNLPDETVASSPRDSVLKLIKRINPDLFIHGVVNGTYNAPFFVTRFREAIFHFSALFDMFEATMPREDEQRMMFEREIFGRDAMNVIACEGSERVERPETYKQWQARNLRAGFRQLPLDMEIFKRVKSTVKSDFHKDFVVDQDGQWMLQGWKGRIIHALSCWKPA